MIRLDNDGGPRVPPYKARQLNGYETALMEVYGVDGVAVGDTVDGWVADLVEGTGLNLAEVQFQAQEIVHSAAERKISFLSLLGELNGFFRELELIE